MQSIKTMSLGRRSGSAKTRTLGPGGLDITETKQLLDEANLEGLTWHQAPRDLVILKHTATVGETLEELAKAHILSAPVIAVPEGQKPTKSFMHMIRNAIPEGPKPAKSFMHMIHDVIAPSKYKGDVSKGPRWPANKGDVEMWGFIDMRDILQSFLHEFKASELLGMSQLDMVKHMEKKGEEFSKKPLHMLPVNKPFHCVTHASVDNVKEVVHRVALFDLHKKVRNIYTQSDIVRFLHTHRGKLAGVVKVSVEELGLVGNDVHSIKADKTVIEAVERIVTERVAALAVVDEHGKMVGDFTLSEMRTLMADYFGSLAMPLAFFLKLQKTLQTADMLERKTLQTAELLERVRSVEHTKSYSSCATATVPCSYMTTATCHAAT
eukprot:gene20681-27476_t